MNLTSNVRDYARTRTGGQILLDALRAVAVIAIMIIGGMSLGGDI